MPTGILFLSGIRLFVIRALFGIADGSVARNRINVAGITPQAGSFVNRWLIVKNNTNLRHRQYTVKSFLARWSLSAYKIKSSGLLTIRINLWQLRKLLLTGEYLFLNLDQGVG